MKRILLTVLFILCSVLLCSCSGQSHVMPAATEQPYVAPTPQATPMVEEVQPEVLSNDFCLYASKMMDTQEIYDPRDQQILIATVEVNKPFITIENDSAVSDKINEVLRAIDETFYTGDDYGYGSDFGVDLTYFQTLAEDNFTLLAEAGMESNIVPYTLTRDYSISRADDKVITIDFINTMLADTESTFSYSFHFDAGTGELLSSDALNSDQYKEETVSGLQPELTFLSQEELSAQSVPILDLVEADPTEEEYILFGAKDITNFRINRAAYLDDSSEFVKGEELWFCSNLTGYAIQLRTVVPEGIPNLMISYEGPDGNIIENVLGYNGQSGGAVLIQQ